MIEFVDYFPRLYRVGTALRVAFANYSTFDNCTLSRNAWLERERLPVTLAKRIKLSFCALAGACAIQPDSLFVADNVAFNYHFDKLLFVVLFHTHQLLKGYCLFLFDNTNIIILFRLASD